MDKETAERLIEAVKKVANGLGWIAFWLFFITLNTCSLYDISKPTP